MICTCTLNPSLDYFMDFERPLRPGAYNRSRNEYYEAGGKGINVSIVLSNLQIPSRATGFVGGFSKDFFISLLEKYPFIQPNFTYIEGNTRINIKASDPFHETTMNGAGPDIRPEDMENLMTKTNRLDEGDFFVLAGNCPDYLEEDVIILLERLIHDGVRVVLDTRSSICRRLAQSHPFLIKTSAEELEEDRQKELSREEIIEIMKDISRSGVENVIVTLHGNVSALLACEEGLYECEIIRSEKTVSMVGAGDALIGGFLMTSMRAAEPVEAFRFGCCCSSATVYTRGFAKREMIEGISEQTKVRLLEGPEKNG